MTPATKRRRAGSPAIRQVRVRYCRLHDEIRDLAQEAVRLGVPEAGVLLEVERRMGQAKTD